MYPFGIGFCPLNIIACNGYIEQIQHLQGSGGDFKSAPAFTSDDPDLYTLFLQEVKQVHNVLIVLEIPEMPLFI
ncbi:hypothetical protein D3C76_1839110 [compost metagenome]